MSARASGQVWKLSQHKGSELLVLLAIADNAKDDGRDAWPGIPELARKTRLTERNIQLILRKLEISGELVIERNAGPHRSNLYHLMLMGEKIAPSDGEKITPIDGEDISPVKSFQGEIQCIEMVKSSAFPDEIPPTPPYKEELIKLTVNKPSRRERAPNPTRIPDDFALTPELYAYAADKGVTAAEADGVTEEFILYWQAASGRSAIKTDWKKAWMLRILDRLQMGKIGPMARNGSTRSNGYRSQADINSPRLGKVVRGSVAASTEPRRGRGDGSEAMKIEPVRQFVTSGFWDEWPSEVTPDGKEDAYAHLVGVEVNAGGHLTRVDAKGTHESEGTAVDRGVVVRVEFQTEEGEQFNLAMHFHKGCTYARTERLSDLARLADGDMPGWRGVIWRD
ncbi:MAG: helix-turn-helix domain-containing protein [Thermomicrobia bacterium]|nr:helix-turn-helix domain-containing protein [Thermomicrobia bacterium]